MTTLARRHLDALSEFMNVGAGHAAKALNEMLGVSAELQVPKVDYWRPAACQAALRRACGSRLDQVTMSFTGSVVGHAALLVEPVLTRPLAELGLGVPAEECESADVRAMLEEMGNIILNATMGSLSNVVGADLLYRVPQYASKLEANPMFAGERPLVYGRTRLSLRGPGGKLPGTIILLIGTHVPPAFLRALDLYYGASDDDSRFLLPGDMVASDRPSIWTTVLGSCVSVCLLHKTRPVAAMNHYLLASADGRKEIGRYGDRSISAIWEKVSRFDADPRHYRAHVFGGAAMFPDQTFDIGGRNAQVARSELRRLGIQVVEEKVGGEVGVHLTFDTGARRVECRRHKAA